MGVVDDAPCALVLQDWEGVLQDASQSLRSV